VAPARTTREPLIDGGFAVAGAGGADLSVALAIPSPWVLVAPAASAITPVARKATFLYFLIPMLRRQLARATMEAGMEGEK
jgi:hypothetical protein